MQDAGTIAHAAGMCTSRLMRVSWKPKRHKSDRNGMAANLLDSFAPCLPPAPKLSDDKPPTVIDGTNLSAIKGRPTLVGSAAWALARSGSRCFVRKRAGDGGGSGDRAMTCRAA